MKFQKSPPTEHHQERINLYSSNSTTNTTCVYFHLIHSVFLGQNNFPAVINEGFWNLTEVTIDLIQVKENSWLKKFIGIIFIFRRPLIVKASLVLNLPVGIPNGMLTLPVSMCCSESTIVKSSGEGSKDNVAYNWCCIPPLLFGDGLLNLTKIAVITPLQTIVLEAKC